MKKYFRTPSIESIINSLFIIFIGAYIILWYNLARDDSFSLTKRADFISFYTAAKIILSGSQHLLYDLETQASIQQVLIYPIFFKDEVLPYYYPPDLSSSL